MNTLSKPPADAILIGSSSFSFCADGDRVVYFSNLEPFNSHTASNRRAMLRIARRRVRREELQEAFDVGRSTVQRAVNLYRRRGEAMVSRLELGRVAAFWWRSHVSVFSPSIGSASASCVARLWHGHFVRQCAEDSAGCGYPF